MKKATATFSTTLNGSIGSSDTTITLNSTAGVPTDTAVVLVIDATDANGTATPTKKEVIVGVVSGATITSITRGKEGTQQSHSSGAVVVDYVTATHWNDVMTALMVDHLQPSGNHAIATNYDPSHSTLPTQKWSGVALAVNQLTVANSATGNPVDLSATGTDSNIDMTLTPKGTGKVSLLKRYDGWVTGLTAPSTITALGNRSYTVVINSTDYTDRLTPGTRLRLTRTVAPPTQCTSLNGTTQYYSKSSPAGTTFTDDPTFSAWVKLSSYAAGSIISRYNGTSGFDFGVNASGQLYAIGYNAGVANFSQILSYQSLPLNRWVHVAAELDMSAFTNTATTSYLMIDGVDVPAAVSRGGTNPTALVQAGNLEVGSRNAGTQFFPGKIAQVAIYNAHVTQATILASMHQTLSGSETSLISAYSFNNSINDLNANANNLSAQASAAATNADSPFSIQADGTISSTGLEYGIVSAASFSTNTTLTVQVPIGAALPTSGGVSALAYSTVKAPYQFPTARTLWRVQMLNKSSNPVTSNATYGAFMTGGWALKVPIGEWIVGWRGGCYNGTVTTLYFNISSTALTGMLNVAGSNASPFAAYLQSSAAAIIAVGLGVEQPQSLAAAATYVMYTSGAVGTGGIDGTVTQAEMYAEYAFV
jgi:hypothetical protein